jgi:malonyl-CoA/methylmalonyl-CoA synthetase
MAHDSLFPPLLHPPAGEAMRFGDRSITYRELRDAAAWIAERVEGTARVAVWAEPSVESCVAVIGALCAGAAIVPINPKIGERELAHIVADSAPGLVLAAPDPPPPGLASLPSLAVDLGERGGALPAEPDAEAPALILYTSGTTGMPKGVLHARRAIATNLDALAAVWEWSAEDLLVHGLPLFHVHGLVLGTLGPIRLGGRLHHVGRFSAEAIAAGLAQGGTMLFGVPTMYHRLVEAAEQDRAVAEALAGARLLVSGSAPLPVREHMRIERVSGQQIVERYGLTETIMNCSIHASGDRRPGYVGAPLPGIEVQLLADDLTPLDVRDDETIGEVAVRGPNLFLGYLNRPDATEAAFHNGWFLTGDLATRSADGYVRIVGRRATDLIKTGGFKVGAGEVEAALLEHPAVAEAAVTGEPDDDLGERIVAWVVTRPGEHPSPDDLTGHVARLLAAHKRPREIRFLEELPRNEMGKVRKAALKP